MAGKAVPQFAAEANWPHSVIWDKFIMSKKSDITSLPQANALWSHVSSNNHQHFKQNSIITKCFHFFLYVTVQKILTYAELHLMKSLKKKKKSQPKNPVYYTGTWFVTVWSFLLKYSS